MIFAIRDDDTSYFTKPDDLRNAYGSINNIPVSLSVIPKAKYCHGDTYPYGKGSFDREYGRVGDNKALVAYIKEGICTGRFEVLMHGIRHEYFNVDDIYVSETNYLNYEEILNGITNEKYYLEKIFDINIDIFVAPSNSMNKDTFRVLDRLSMNTMCSMSKKMDHSLSLRYIKYYIHRNFNKLLNKNIDIGVRKYKNHKELTMYPINDFQSSWNNYLECKKNNIPYILYTHYWELNANKDLRATLYILIDKMIKDGANASFVSDCF